ncbi:hypothetical protein V12B01_13350 [Vibrio splendidus 12B01]|nr:hypothetical protein V12B01_13350 [Vibrio splendidus 12B01]
MLQPVIRANIEREVNKTRFEALLKRYIFRFR